MELSPARSLKDKNLAQKKTTVMVCDDDKDILTIYSKALEPTYDIISASSGKECLAKYREEKSKGHTIDAVLLDYKLPDINGNMVAESIRKMNGTKVILISAYELDRQMVDGLIDRKYIIKTLDKPIRIARLKEEVEDVLRLSPLAGIKPSEQSKEEEEEEDDSKSKSSLSPEEKEQIVVDAIRDSIDKRLGQGSADLVFKTLRLIYKMDAEAAAKKEPELLEEKIGKILGGKVAEPIIDDAKRQRDYSFKK